jgi:hypothetical protein
MIRIIRRFVTRFVLPLKGDLFLLRRRSLLAPFPLVLNILLYTAAVVLVVHYYEMWSSLLFEQPQSWYLLIGYSVLNFLAFLPILASSCSLSFLSGPSCRRHFSICFPNR